MKTYSLRLFSSMIILCIAIFSCTEDKKKRRKIDPGFGAYISAYTSGLISKKARITVKLAKPYSKKIELNTPIEERLFDFDPGIDGEAYWTDNQTIEFVPEDILPSGKNYEATFFVNKITDVADKFKEFKFDFKVIQQDFHVSIDGLSAYSNKQLEKQQLKGNVVFADVVDGNKVNTIVTAKQGDRSLTINWIPKSDKLYEFTVDTIWRGEDESEVLLQWNGKNLNIEKELETEVEIPAIGDFKITRAFVVQRPEQYVEVRFSDPISNQNLDGLIEVKGSKRVRYIIEGNVLKIYPNRHLNGNHMVEIMAGIKNVNGYKMKDDYSKKLRFEQLKPAVKLVGKGVIVPSSKGLIIPFEAVSLRAVDLYITKVFTNNIIQFFQSNNYDGDYSLNRVGRNVVRKRLNLEKLTKENLHEWNRFHIDLADVMVVDPGAIYRVELRFKKDYSLYGCAEELKPLDDFEAEIEAEDWSVDGGYNDYWDDYYYDWDHRDDPCHSAYYSRNKCKDERNVMASNLGVITKIGADKKVHVIVNDLTTTEPVKGAKIELFDYQQQLIAQDETNGDGVAMIHATRKPFMAIATYENQKGYLRLDDGSALSMSKFDIYGAAVKDGIKGLIYGERGVWRPGDSLYLTFVKEDKEQILPDDHPVSFELTNPQGQIVHRMVKNQSVNGFYDFRTATTPDAITGNYTAKVKIGNRSFYRPVKIETVKPNRLKIYLDFGGKVIKKNSDFLGDLEVKWLHGATAGKLKTKVNAKVSHSRTSFDQFRNYHFDDLTKNFSDDEFTIFDSKLDANGKASIDPELTYSHSAPGMINVSFNTKVFEPGGNFSVDRYTVKYSPYESYAGVNIPKGTLWGNALATDKKHTIDIVTLNEEGKKVNRDNVVVKLYKISWRWWWDRYDNDNVNFLGRSSTVKVEEDKIDTENGLGKFEFKVDDEAWGRYLIHVTDPVSGHTTSKVFYMDLPYWARGNRKNNENATMLGFSSDKEEYKVGEKAKITFPSPDNGRALVCIENGTKVLEKYWVETSKGETKFEFEITEGMAPNVFCNVMLLQPHESTTNDQPIRMFGVIPLMVEDEATRLEPVLKTDEVFRPETSTTITVEEKNDRKMTYTLAIVDEGLLDLTRFKTPDLWKYFYAREALGVKTWDLYDYVMGAYGGELDKLLAIGGDEENGKKKDRKANRFKPMVRFLGPFELDGGDKAKHKIDIPNYVGSVRVMVVAGQDGTYGKAEKAVPVRTPLMVLGTLPRVLSPGETVKLPVNVFAMEDNVKNVKIEVKSNDLLKLTGSSIQQLKFDKVGDKVANFEFKVAEKLGIGKVNIVAKSGKHEAKFEVELDVRTPNSPSVRVVDTLIEPGATWNADYTYFGVEGTNKGYLEISKMPSMNLERRLDYLIRYPHGCVEQTTSSVFPQLYLSSLMDLKEVELNRIENNVKSGIDRLRSFQTSSGGFSYWPGETYVNDWGTNYASHFLLEAEKKGYTLPIGMRNEFINYQKDRARNWSNSQNRNYENIQLIQAYRLYVLALANEAELGAMNRLRELPQLNQEAKWRLAAAYQMAGQPEVAVQLIEGLTTHVKPYRELSYTYGSNIRDEAMILETLSHMKKLDKAAPIAIQLAEKSKSNRWMSTQTTAYMLVAVSTFLGDQKQGNSMEFETIVTDLDEEDIDTEKTVFKQKFSDAKKSGKVSVKNTGDGKLFVRMVTEGVAVAGNEINSSENVKMTINYTDMDGNTIDVKKIKQSTDFIAEVVVFNPGTRGYLKEMAINQLFPSGWEIINNRMEAGPDMLKGSIPTYQDIRDDRVYSYFNIASGKTKRFKIQLNATYMGRFYLPGVVCEAMYDNTINSQVAGKWVEVIPAE